MRPRRIGRATSARAGGHEISEAERRVALRPENGARWVATAPEGVRHPGFHIDGFCSLMMSYEAIANDYLKQSTSEIGLKGFYNLVLAPALPVSRRCARSRKAAGPAEDNTCIAAMCRRMG